MVVSMGMSVRMAVGVIVMPVFVTFYALCFRTVLMLVLFTTIRMRMLVLVAVIVIVLVAGMAMVVIVIMATITVAITFSIATTATRLSFWYRSRLILVFTDNRYVQSGD